MKGFIKNNFISLLILILFLVLLFRKTPSDVRIVKSRDTVWVIKDSIIYSKPQIVQTIKVPYDRWNTKYIPDTNYHTLRQQYIELVDKYISSNVFKDSIKIDSIGFVSITDTINENYIKGRKTSYNLKYPIIKETIILPPKNQLYLGGDVQTGIMSQISAGILFKNKQDYILGIKGGINTLGQTHVGISSYWKLSFKKK